MTEMGVPDLSKAGQEDDDAEAGQREKQSVGEDIVLGQVNALKAVREWHDVRIPGVGERRVVFF